MCDIPQYISVIVIILGIFVEITPIKFSPLAWLGNRLNRDTIKKMDKINSDLQEHIADDMRNYILFFQKRLMKHEQHTQEDFKRAYNMCDKYEKYIEANKLKNSEIEDAILYIRSVYMECLKSGAFIDSKHISKSDLTD